MKRQDHILGRITEQQVLGQMFGQREDEVPTRQEDEDSTFVAKVADVAQDRFD